MRLSEAHLKSLSHLGLANVTPNQHHFQPQVVSANNTTLSVPPLPGGPAIWDVVVPFDAQAVIFSLRSPWVTEAAGGNAGVTGVATRSSLDTTTASLGGDGTLSSTSYNAIYTKAAGALNLSHKVFNAGAGNTVALTEASLVQTGPSTRVFRTQWTNYGASLETLSAYLELGLL